MAALLAFDPLALTISPLSTMSSSQAGPSTSLLKDAISGAGPKVTACQACTSLIARTGDELLCGGCKVSFCTCTFLTRSDPKQAS